MSKRFFYILVLLCLLVTPPLRAQWGRTDGDSWVNTDYNTTEGTDFWLTFMFNYGNTEDDIIDLHLRVFATARQNARVTVHYADGTSESFNVKAFSRAQHDIDIGKGYVIREKEVERKGIHVTSTVPISLYAVSQNAEAGSQDATNVLPTKALQKEYVIQTYGTDGVSTEFALVATKYVSNITINVKKTHNTNPSRNSEDIVQTGAMYPGDVYLYRSNGANYSLSGTQICSNVPIAVFVGGQHADIPIRTSNKNHIYSQAMPTDMWGKIFVATKTYGQRWDYLRFTAAENNTALSVYDGATNSYTTITPSPLSPLDTYQDSIYSPNSGAMAKVYKTNKAVETFLYMTDFTMNSTGVTPDGVILGEGSPAMAPIAPMEQGLKSLVFTTLDAQNIQNHYVNIATYYDSRNNIQLDNTNIGHLFKRISGTPYAFLDMPIDTGAHILVNTNPRDIHGIFTAHVYGLGRPADGTRRESYAYSAGSRIERSIDMLIDGQYIKQKDVCIPNTTIFTPVINQDFKNYHWQFYPANPSSTVISSGDYTTIRDYTVQLPDTGRWDVSLIVNYSTPLCANIITDTVKAIINMHDTVHIDRGYNDQQARNICYGEDFYVHYERGITYNYVADSSTVQHIFGKNTKFELNKEYIFKDTLENKWGCDSIIWQHVIIRPTYDTIIFDTTCYQHLPYEWRRQDNGVLIKRLTKNDLYNKHNLHLTGESLFKVDSIITTKENLRTRYGCDSLVALKLLVMPDYLIDDGSDQACQDSIYGYNWSSSNNPKHKHTDANGKVLTGHRNLWMQKVGTNKKVHILPGQYISLKTPGTYTLVDSLKTSHVCRSCDDAAGCDSVHIKTIVIQERKQKILPKLNLCDNHYIVALNDTLCVGYKYKGTIPEPWRSANRYIVVNKDITLVNHSSTQDVLQCDSITMQQVHLCRSFENNPIVVSLCQGTDKYDWKKADNGKIIQSITIPSSDHYPVSFNYTDTLTASGHCNCDSIVHLTLTINPTYDTTLYDTICDVSLPYKWIVHDNSTNKDRTISISRPSSETSNVWHTTHQETLHTKKGCDSIVHLDLIVYPTVRTNVPIALCPEQLPYQYCENGATVPVGYKGGTKTETLASHQFPMSCDSIVTYHISVSAENVIDIPVRRCDDDLPYSYVYPTLPSNATHTRLLTDIHETGIYLDTVSIEGQCRTIYRLNFTVDKTYDDTLNLVNVCVNNLPYAWKVKDKKGNSRTISINIPGNKVLPFDTLCTANLKSIHDCDSIVNLPLRVHPTYTTHVYDTICQTSLPYTWRDGKGSSLRQIRLTDIRNSGVWKSPDWTYTTDYNHHSQYSCDSILTLHLTVYPTVATDTTIQLCPEQLPYQYCENGATVPVGYKGGTKTETLASHQFPMSCDSIVTYHISVSAENVIDIPVRRCDDDLPYSYVYPTLPSNATHTRLLTDIRETGIYLDTVSIEGQCRTIYRLNFTVDKTYDDTLNLVNVCVNNLPYAWKIKDKKGNSRTISINIPGNKVLPFDTLCTANLKSIHDCDSIVHLPLRINPIYNNDTTIKICDVEADGFIYSFGKDKYVFNRHSDLDHQHILRIDTGLLTPSSALCDSAMRLHLIVYPSYKIDSVRTICEGDSTWWQGSWLKGKLQSRVEGASFPELGPTEYVSDYYERHYSALNACDSLHTLTLMVLPRRYTHIDTAMCDYENYRFGDRVHTHEHGVYYDTLRLQTIGNKSCDSIVTLRLTVYESYHRDTTIKICDVEADGFIYSFGKDKYVFNRHSDLDHQHILRIDTGLLTPSSALCDSAMRLHLIVYPSYKIDSVRTICEGDSTWWQGSWRKGKLQSRVEGASFPELGPTEYVSDYYERHYSALNACDSLHTLTLNVIPRRYTHIDTAICDYEYYIFGTTRHVHARGVYYDTLHLQTTTAPQCDSIVTLKLTVHESYHRDTTIKICDTEADYFVYNFGIKEYRFDRQDLIDHQTVLYIDTVLTTPSSQQCDSAIVLHLIVAPTYDFYETLPLCENDSLSWQGMLFVGNQYEAYGKTYSEVGFDSTRIVSHGTYNIDIRRTTILACDSTYHLTLHVNEVAHVDWIDSVCQNHSFHNPNWNWGEGKDMDTRKVGTYVSVDTIHSPITACDSIITLTLRVDSVYDYRPYFEFCQDRTATSEVVNWTDDAGNTRTFTLDISAADTFSYIEPHTSIHGCDSTYGVTWIVHPTYYFYDTLHICENGYTEWQNTRFTGDSLRNMSAADSIILKPGIYHEFRHYETTALCDSDYYATIYVHPIYDTLSSITVCESDGFIWHQDERPHGEYRTYADTIIPVAYCDTIRLLPYEADMPQPRRDTVMRYSTRLLQTVDGCDSLSRLALTVQPTYFFLTDTTICSNDRVKYRGKYFSSRDTIYTDHQYTEDRCDSIYQLRLHVRPIFMNVRRVTMCDNETLYHPSLNNNDVVWEPGNEIRDSIWEYYDMIYTDKDGCDSIYRYYLTIHKSHHFYDTATICSNESYVTERHTYTGYEFEYDTNLSMMPYDTTIVNRYATIHGCDSVYKLTATIKPAYRHRDTITICDNEEIDWRGFHYQGNKFGNVLGNGYPKGEHIFYDSLKTAIHDCDSIYELHLMVQPTYRKDTAITKCENDDLTWRSFNLNNVAVGHHFYYDSLTTVQYGCDSVYHLYLTVNPVVDTVCYDTICFGETYYYGNKKAYEDGVYRDTVKSMRYGCDSIILAYLEVIEPTVPTAWADSICADDEAYDLFYTYTGEYDPIAYSVKYDEEGHRNGFEDIIDQPITSPDELSWLRIPMPNVKEDRTNYPKPNYYNITLILDNGRCKDPEKWCSTDTSIVLSYPSWITRQRFGDVIALYNDKYNGGYKWWNYQWYHGNELLPGETHEYLYVPTGLVVGDQYHVRLTREGEVQDFQTCPITIVADPIYNDFAPNMGYLSVVPTCVCSCNPYINILSRKDGTYRITTADGKFVTDGVFRADVTKVVKVPSIDGTYVVQLWSNDTPEEPYRYIKIIVSPKCVPEHYENISF